MRKSSPRACATNGTKSQDDSRRSSSTNHWPHSVGLISGALRVDVRHLPHDVKAAANEALALTLKTGWFGAAAGSDPDFEPAELYPIHPTVVPVLVRFFARFGAHERSLFSFLLSNEPYGLQAYAAPPIGPTSWYRIADFYDYVRAVFGDSLEQHAETKYRT